MSEAPTVYVIPKHLAVRATRLRRVALAHVLIMPVAIWVSIALGFRGVRAAIVSMAIAVGLLLLPQFAALGAPRTMQRRFHRLTRQAALLVVLAVALLAAALAIHVRLAFIALGTLALDVPVAAYLLVSLPVYLIPHPEDVSRQQ